MGAVGLGCVNIGAELTWNHGSAHPVHVPELRVVVLRYDLEVGVPMSVPRRSVVNAFFSIEV